MKNSNLASKQEDSLLFVGTLFVLLGVCVNQWVLVSKFSSDGSIPSSSAIAIWLFDVTMVLVGLTIMRKRSLIYSAVFGNAERALKSILGFGIILRIVVYVFLGPNNNDPHIQVIDFIVKTGKLPISGQLLPSFHPPLYYLIATPLAMMGSPKVVQFLSLVLSLGNLVLLYFMIRATRLLHNDGAKCHALMLASLLPQFIFFSSFVSNDTLAFVVGTFIFFQGFRYIERPTRINLGYLGVLVGIGLLTKATLLATGPAIALIIVMIGVRQRLPPLRHLTALAFFGLIALGVGSYKFIENTVYFGKPILTGDDLRYAYVARHQGTYQGVKSILDANLVKLVRYPFLDEQTKHSIPLLMYGTFWYSYIQESNFIATRQAPLSLLPRAVYVAGVLPTLLMLVGMTICIWRNRSPAETIRASDPMFSQRVAELLIVSSFLLNLALVLVWGFQHDAWSFFQGRLLFQSIFPMIIFFGLGFQALSHNGSLRRSLNFTLLSAYFVLLAYISTEIGAGTMRFFVHGKLNY